MTCASASDADRMWQRQRELARQLRTVCDDEGKETDTIKSASIFNEMGSLYSMKSPDKISLIRSAALLNAAVIRQPSNKKYEKDLKKLCHDILATAKVEQLDTDLVTISCDVMKLINGMRKKTKERLNGLPKISYDMTASEKKRLETRVVSKMQSLQDFITEKYTEIMRYISRKCERIMGGAPCKFSITGMGSLARGEITPYSDFEHCILLKEGVQYRENYQSILEYLRWFSVIFNVIVVNLQETIVPCVNIPSLADPKKTDGSSWLFDVPTKCGISFDGMKFFACKMPLGRTEKTQQKPWTTELIRSKNKKGHFMELMPVLQEDLENLEVLSSIYHAESKKKLDIKRVVYRSSTLFVAALTSLHAVVEGSTFSAINQMLENKLITEETAHLLSYAVAASCQVRLLVYMKEQSQDDHINKDMPQQTLIGFLGEWGAVSLFQIADALNKAFIKAEVVCKAVLCISSKADREFSILSFFGLYDRFLAQYQRYLKFRPANVSSSEDIFIKESAATAYYMKDQFENSLSIHRWLEGQVTKNSFITLSVMNGIARCLYQLGEKSESRRYTEEVKLKVSQKSKLGDDEKQKVLETIHNMDEAEHGHGLSMLGGLLDMVDLHLHVNVDDKPKEKLEKANALEVWAFGLVELGDHDSAMVYATKALKVFAEQNLTEKKAASQSEIYLWPYYVISTAHVKNKVGPRYVRHSTARDIC
ncbi:unnamed protein product [Clavelina lepadiformis]|uniref:Protein-PII uridylyltransferase N-terminal domain-containing protein n=1 Tax=Clavelina lepadiformis TaxID=159417 RepID=A0ABP0FJP1_CLALP